MSTINESAADNQAFTPSLDLFPFESRWFDTNGIRVHYVDEGGGMPILMCHGNPAWSFMYRHAIRGLRDRFRCIAVDYPGFGLSDRPEHYGYTPREHAEVVGHLVAHLGLSDMIVMGLDWGGPIGMAIASEHSDRIGGLVLMNTWFWPADRLIMHAFSRVMSTVPMRWLIVERNLFVNWLIHSGIRRTLSPEEAAHYRLAQPTPRARRGVAELPRQVLASSKWFELLEEQPPRRLGDKPMQLIWGTHDRVFGNPAVIARWKQYFPHAEVTLLPGAGRCVPEDAPQQLIDAVSTRFTQTRS